MKKRLISIILVFCIAFSMILPAMAADTPWDITKRTVEQLINNRASDIKAVSNMVIDLIKYAVEKFSDIKSTDWFVENVSKLLGMGVINGYPDGTFKPDGNINADEFIKMIVTLKGFKLDNGTSYWADPFISKAKELGLVQDGEFSTYERPVTRQEMARIIVRALNETYPANYQAYKNNLKDFNSIPSNYADFILKAYSKGIITGYEDGTFKGSNNATRAEAATIIVRMADETKRVVPGVSATPTPTVTTVPTPTPVPTPTTTVTPTPTPTQTPQRIIEYTKWTNIEDVEDFPQVLELANSFDGTIKIASSTWSPKNSITVYFMDDKEKRGIVFVEFYRNNNTKDIVRVAITADKYCDKTIGVIKKALELAYPDDPDIQEVAYNEMLSDRDNPKGGIYQLNDNYWVSVSINKDMTDIIWKSESFGVKYSLSKGKL